MGSSASAMLKAASSSVQKVPSTPSRREVCSFTTVTGRPVAAVSSRSSRARRAATVCPDSPSGPSGWGATIRPAGLPSVS
jgi:hypothetical protein